MAPLITEMSAKPSLLEKNVIAESNMKKKMYKAGKGMGGLHTKGSAMKLKTSLGTRGSQRHVASRGKKIILGSNNSGSTDLANGVTRR